MATCRFDLQKEGLVEENGVISLYDLARWLAGNIYTAQLRDKRNRSLVQVRVSQLPLTGLSRKRCRDKFATRNSVQQITQKSLKF